MRRTWTDRQLSGLRASAANAGVTLIGRRLQNAESVERLQAAGIDLGQGAFAGGALVSTAALRAQVAATGAPAVHELTKEPV
ncbi:hypothetical protein D9M69_690860 [compost metagenome]